MKRGLIALSIVMMAVYLCAFAAIPREAQIATSKRPANETAPKPPLLDPHSNPHALLTLAFKDSGWTQYQASVHASRILGREVNLVGDEVRDFNAPPPGKPGVPLLCPTSNPHALLTSLLKDSGWSQLEASQFASAMLGHPAEAFGPLSERCWLSMIMIVYCDGEGVLRSKSEYLNGQCWTADPPGGGDNLKECIQDYLACATGGDVHWLKLKVDSSCFGLTDGQCVFVRIDPPEWTDCQEHQTFPDCECFEELNPTNCAAIEHFCCPSNGTGPCIQECPLGGCN